MSPKATFALAARLREPGGAPIGDVFAYLSGLYFRGKLTYARTFGAQSSWIITTNQGLLAPEEPVEPDDIRSFASVDLSEAGDEFLHPLQRDATRLAADQADGAPVVLLGSIATNKYVGPLQQIFGERLVFPREFIGRGDMSRGGLLLRCASEGRELEYIPVANAVRHGKRPPKLEPLAKAVGDSGRKGPS